jgi:hypothetical protein
VVSQEVEDNGEDEEIPEVAEDNSRESVDVVANKATTTITTVEGVVALGVVEDLAGRITTSHSETVMHLSTLNLTGRCWRRLTSTAWLS